MDLKDIKSLIQFISKSGAEKVSLKVGEIEISVENNFHSLGRNQVPKDFSLSQTSLSQSDCGKLESTFPVQNKELPLASGEEKINEENFIVLKSPMIGTFYSKPSPEKDSFVKVGDHIEIGTKVCIIEAMKLFNEIESEFSGKIVKVLVQDNSPVEYDQPLFLIDPS